MGVGVDNDCGMARNIEAKSRTRTKSKTRNMAKTKTKTKSIEKLRTMWTMTTRRDKWREAGVPGKLEKGGVDGEEGGQVREV